MERQQFPAPGSPRPLVSLVVLVTLALVASCNDGGEDSPDLLVPGGSAAPAQLRYDDNRAIYTQNVEIVPEVPTFQNSAQSFGVAPALPAGLALDGTTGVISGRPEDVVLPTDFVVTASNPAGSTSVVVTISVQPGPVPPQNLRYPDDDIVWIAGEELAETTAKVAGQPTSFSVSPSLPAGVALDPWTGELSGTPTTATASATYTVTAANVAGSAQTKLEIEVLAESDAMRLVVASHGFGQLLPHRTTVPDANGSSTSQVIAIRTLDDLVDNVTLTNPVLPNTEWPSTAILPSGTAGNHFIYAEFTQPIDIDSVLTLLPSSQSTSFLKGTITVDAVDPVTGAATPVVGRPFVDGYTPGDVNPATGLLELERWIGTDATGKPVALDVGGETPGDGFPGTQGFSFAGASDLVARNALVFVPDVDGDLSTLETFPTGRQIRFNIRESVRSEGGVNLRAPGVAHGTVGRDMLPPEVGFSPITQFPDVTPATGSFDVPADEPITVRFTEAVQPLSVGVFPGDLPFAFSTTAIRLQVGPAAFPTDVPHTAIPASPFDLTRYVVRPVTPFPGDGGSGLACNTGSLVTVQVEPFRLLDLQQPPNVNSLATSSFHEIAGGARYVNAPVTPDAILVGRAGARPGISLVDLNGFGAGTGNPTYDPANPAKPGNSNYPNNPNLQQQGPSLVPPLTPGSCTLDGGSSGAMTLARSSSLDALLAGPPLLSSVRDMVLGGPLDVVFSNGPPPFGCQAGGGNLCASAGLKQFRASVDGNVLEPDPSVVGGFSGNVVSWAPHPNPPPLVYPGLCLSPDIGALEPTSIESSGLTNLLQPSTNFLGDASLGIAPQGIASPEQNAHFVGPSTNQISVANCSSYQVRQQIGNFLYVADAERSEVAVLNSNRFTVLDRIPVPTPEGLAMSPDLGFLAVTSPSDGSVSFIDTNPGSIGFHSVVATAVVGGTPSGVAWQPDGEDVLVCDTTGERLVVISAATFGVREALTDFPAAPFDVVATHRQFGFGLSTGTYFAFVLCRDGSLVLYESGEYSPAAPSHVTEGNLDRVAPFRFDEPNAIAISPTDVGGGAWIAHRAALDLATGAPLADSGGAISGVVLTGGSGGEVSFELVASIGPGVLTGVPTDLAFDDLRNLGGLPGVGSVLSPGNPIATNSKSLLRSVNGRAVPTSTPTFLFASVPFSSEGTGAIDVLRLDANLARLDVNTLEPGIQSIPVEGPAILTSYFSQ